MIPEIKACHRHSRIIPCYFTVQQKHSTPRMSNISWQICTKQLVFVTKGRKCTCIPHLQKLTFGFFGTYLMSKNQLKLKSNLYLSLISCKSRWNFSSNTLFYTPFYFFSSAFYSWNIYPFTFRKKMYSWNWKGFIWFP